MGVTALPLGCVAGLPFGCAAGLLPWSTMTVAERRSTLAESSAICPPRVVSSRATIAAMVSGVFSCILWEFLLDMSVLGAGDHNMFCSPRSPAQLAGELCPRSPGRSADELERWTRDFAEPGNASPYCTSIGVIWDSWGGTQGLDRTRAMFATLFGSFDQRALDRPLILFCHHFWAGEATTHPRLPRPAATPRMSVLAASGAHTRPISSPQPRTPTQKSGRQRPTPPNQCAATPKAGFEQAAQHIMALTRAAKLCALPLAPHKGGAGASTLYRGRGGRSPPAPASPQTTPGNPMREAWVRKYPWEPKS